MVRVERLGVRSERAVTARRMVCSVSRTGWGGRQETPRQQRPFARALWMKCVMTITTTRFPNYLAFGRQSFFNVPALLRIEDATHFA